MSYGIAVLKGELYAKMIEDCGGEEEELLENPKKTLEEKSVPLREIKQFDSRIEGPYQALVRKEGKKIADTARARIVYNWIVKKYLVSYKKGGRTIMACIVVSGGRRGTTIEKL